MYKAFKALVYELDWRENETAYYVWGCIGLWILVSVVFHMMGVESSGDYMMEVAGN